MLMLGMQKNFDMHEGSVTFHPERSQATLISPLPKLSKIGWNCLASQGLCVELDAESTFDRHTAAILQHQDPWLLRCTKKGKLPQNANRSNSSKILLYHLQTHCRWKSSSLSTSETLTVGVLVLTSRVPLVCSTELNEGNHDHSKQYLNISKLAICLPHR